MQAADDNPAHDNGTPGESRRRKATDLLLQHHAAGMAAGLPKAPLLEASAMRSFSFLGSRFSRVAAPALLGASLLGGIMAQAPAAHADMLFCWDDPVVVVNNVPVHIDLGIQASAATIQKSISQVTIVVHVQKGATAVVLPASTPDYPATVTVKYDKGGVWKSGSTQVQVDTTFALNGHAVALNSKESISTPNAVASAQATIQGSMNLDVSVP